MAGSIYQELENFVMVTVWAFLCDIVLNYHEFVEPTWYLFDLPHTASVGVLAGLFLSSGARGLQAGRLRVCLFEAIYINYLIEVPFYHRSAGVCSTGRAAGRRIRMALWGGGKEGC